MLMFIKAMSSTNSHAISVDEILDGLKVFSLSILSRMSVQYAHLTQISKLPFSSLIVLRSPPSSAEITPNVHLPQFAFAQ